MTTRKVNSRNRVMTIFNIMLVLIVIFFWIYGVVGYDLQRRNLTDFFNSSEYVFNCTSVPFTYQYTWLIPIPFTFFLLLFPGNFLISNVINMFCPITFMKKNNKYMSCNYPEPTSSRPPHTVTISVPVYKESFEKVIKPTLLSLMACREYYEDDQVIDVNIIVSDDGLNCIGDDEQNIRVQFYRDNNIAYVARPVKNRVGKFKKASNLNFTMNICELFDRVRNEYGLPNYTDVNKIVTQLLSEFGCETVVDGELVIGDFILLVDADSRIPLDCFDHVLTEFDEDDNLGFTQHLTVPFRITRSFWESFISHFTRLINEYAIFIACAGGNMSPLIGHNAIIRVKAMNKITTTSTTSVINDIVATFKDCEYTYEKVWSEENVSEDFKMFMDMVENGYYGRYVTYTGDGFVEGVSLSYDDELDKFKKYTYGSCEIMLGSIPDICCSKACPINRTICRYLRTNIDFSSKINLISYLCSYISIASSILIVYINYFLYGWYPECMEGLVSPIDVLVQVVLLFFGLGIVSHIVVKMRYDKKKYCKIIIDDIKYIPIYILFFGSIQYHLFKVVMNYIFCSKENSKISWGSTSKEITESTSRCKVFCDTIRKHMDVYIIFGLTTLMMIILSLPVIPERWRIDEYEAFIPLTLMCGFHMVAPVLLNPYITSGTVYLTRFQR